MEAKFITEYWLDDKRTKRFAIHVDTLGLIVENEDFKDWLIAHPRVPLHITEDGKRMSADLKLGRANYLCGRWKYEFLEHKRLEKDALVWA